MHSRELYDHRKDIPGTPDWEAVDDFEDKNLVEQNADVARNMAAKLRSAFASAPPDMDAVAAEMRALVGAS